MTRPHKNLSKTAKELRQERLNAYHKGRHKARAKTKDTDVKDSSDEDEIDELSQAMSAATITKMRERRGAVSGPSGAPLQGFPQDLGAAKK